ncbi:MAG: LamG-like jellyroll fold domain-containing protein [Vicingaceae bacterium]
MKKILLALLVTLTLSGFGQNLIHYYPMNRINNSPGSDYYEDRAGGANLFPQNSTTTYPVAMPGVRDTLLDKSIHFEGSSGNLALQASSTTDNRNWTGAAYSVWVRTTASGSTMRIVQFPYGGYGLSIGSGGRVNAIFDGSSAGALVSNKKVNDGLWHHIVAYNNGSNSFIYIDGVYDNAQAETLFTPTSVNSDAKLRVGATRFVNDEFEGQIDELRLYDDILTNAQVTALYNSTKQGAILYEEARYNFNGTFRDSSTHRINLQNNNGNRFSFGEGRTPNSTDSSMVATASNASLRTTEKIFNLNWSEAAVSVWIKNCANGMVLQAYQSGYAIEMDANGNVKTFFDGSGAGALVSTAGAGILDTNWHHIVAQNDGDTTYLYVDGVLNNQQAEPFYSQPNFGTFQYLYIGSGLYFNGNTPVYYKYLDGQIDDLAVYSRALSNQEVQDLYNFGTLTGDKELSKSVIEDIQVYPNPTTNKLNLPIEVQNAELIKIYNQNGQVIQENSKAQQLDVSQLSRGVYYLFILNDGQQYRSKFLKQ